MLLEPLGDIVATAFGAYREARCGRPTHRTGWLRPGSHSRGFECRL